MENLSKALYLAGFALLFVFAASTAIYLYSTLMTYLTDATASTNIEYRVENSNSSVPSNFKRTITTGEVYITLFNMEQMHVETLVLDYDYRVTVEDVSSRDDKFKNFINHLRTLEGSTLTYSVSGSTVSYTS
ncbi:MAG: hypothetical protein IJ220_05000 [Clostridia bacterium]|nr:hypothetical protein [Clostridia bacterium]